MTITKKDVQYIAGLARLNLTADEEEIFERELEEILLFAEKLNEVDTSAVPPQTGGTNLKNIWREDDSFTEGLPTRSSELVETAPDQQEWWIKVRSVFED